VAFLLLEPVPVWQRTSSHPPERRFTGGWAWITAILAQGVFASLIEGWYDSVPW